MVKYKNVFLAFFLVIFTATFSSCTKYNFKYQKSVAKSYKDMKIIKLFPLNKLVEVVVTADTNIYQFVDIRNPHQYVNGHILNAKSLPLKSMYGKNISIFCNNKKIFLLYGNDASEARLAYSYLEELGIKNIYPLGGGYNFIEKNIIKQFGVRSNTYDDEIARYDYAKVIAQTSGSSVSNSNASTSAPPMPVIKRKKTATNVGGCE